MHGIDTSGCIKRRESQGVFSSLELQEEYATALTWNYDL